MCLNCNEFAYDINHIIVHAASHEEASPHTPTLPSKRASLRYEPQRGVVSTAGALRRCAHPRKKIGEKGAVEIPL